MALIGIFEILLAFVASLILHYISVTNNTLLRYWPVVGMLPDLLLQVHRIHDFFVDLLEQSQCTFLFKGPCFAKMDYLVTTEPANIHYIMSSNFSNFHKGPEFKKILEVLGDGIFNADADSWKLQRKLTQKFINHREFYGFLVRTSRDKLERGIIPVLEHVCRKGLVVDLQDLFQRFTFDTTCMFVTGHDPCCLSVEFPEVEFAKALDDAEEAIFYRHVFPETLWKLQKWMNVGNEKKLHEAWQTLDRVIVDIISAKKEKQRKLEEESSKDSCGFDLLTSCMGEEGIKGLNSDDRFLRDTIINIMIAGRDTTSSALTWFFYLVWKNPRAETKIREELKSTIPSTEGEMLRLFDIEEVKNMVYLHASLCETLRLYPPVPFQHKAPIKPDTLPSGHQVNPDMKILFSLYALGRMSSIWGDDCSEFRPERWISEAGKIKHEPSYKFLAFNAGPRTCLGKEVAFTQMKAVAAAIISSGYEIVWFGSLVRVWNRGLWADPDNFQKCLGHRALATSHFLQRSKLA